jgi:hypothetical protein
VRFLGSNCMFFMFGSLQYTLNELGSHNERNGNSKRLTLREIYSIKVAREGSLPALLLIFSRIL